MNHWSNDKPITDNLPGFNGKYNRNNVTQWITSYFDEFLVDTKNSVTLIQEYLENLDIAPDKYLDFFGNLAGFTGPYWEITYPKSLKIALIQKANWIWSNKGSKEVLSYVLTHYGLENIVVNDGAFIIGSNVIGDRLGERPWSYLIYTNPRQLNYDFLSKKIPLFQRLYAPLWARGTIIEDFSRFAKFRILGNYQDDTGQAISPDLEVFFSVSTQVELGQNTDTLTEVTRDYKNRIEAVGYFQPISFWRTFDNLIKSLDTENIEYLNLFIGENLAQKSIPVIETSNQTFSLSLSQTGQASIIFDDLDSIKIECNNEPDYVNFSFSVTLNDSDNFISFLDVNNTPLFSTNKDEFINRGLTSNDFNTFLTLKNDIQLLFNKYIIEDTSITVDKTNFVLGENGTDNGFSGNLYYLLAGRNSDRSSINGQRITDYLLTRGINIEGINSRYHLDTLIYNDKVNDNGSALSISAINNIDSLINQFYNAGLYEKCQYLYLFSTDLNSSAIAIKGPLLTSSGIVNGDSSSIQTGLLYSDNQNIIDDEYAVSDFLNESFTHLFSAYQNVNSINETELFTLQTLSNIYGVKYNSTQDKLKYFGFSGINPDIEISANLLTGVKAISIDGNVTDTTFEYYNDGDKIGEVTRSINAFTTQDLKLGYSQSTIQIYSFGKFDYLTSSEVKIASNILKNFNTNVGRLI